MRRDGGELSYTVTASVGDGTLTGRKAATLPPGRRGENPTRTCAGWVGKSAEITAADSVVSSEALTTGYGPGAVTRLRGRRRPFAA